MVIKRAGDIKPGEITDKQTYLNRRLFMRAAVLAGTATATTLVYHRLNPPPPEIPKGEKLEAAKPATANAAHDGFTVAEKLTPREDITTYNNFYEFSTSKGEVASEAKGFVTRPWSVAVEGLVNKPRIFDLDELLKFQQEE